jgi:hypothetical protein
MLDSFVPRVERSETRVWHFRWAAPDFAALNPGYISPDEDW